jgi:hypothetical protein
MIGCLQSCKRAGSDTQVPVYLAAAIAELPEPK